MTNLKENSSGHGGSMNKYEYSIYEKNTDKINIICIISSNIIEANKEILKEIKRIEERENIILLIRDISIVGKGLE